MSDVKRYGVFDLLHLTLLGDERFVYASDYDAIQADRDRLAAELSAARADAERVEWFFGPHEKMAFIATYLEGVAANWSVDQWRAAIDAARATPSAGGPQS